MNVPKKRYSVFNMTNWFIHAVTKCSPDAKDGLHHSQEKLSPQLLVGVRLHSGSVRLDSSELFFQNKNTNSFLFFFFSSF